MSRMAHVESKNETKMRGINVSTRKIVEKCARTICLFSPMRFQLIVHATSDTLYRDAHPYHDMVRCLFVYNSPLFSLLNSTLTAKRLTAVRGILSLTTIALAKNQKMNKKSNKIFECLQSTEIDTQNNFEKEKKQQKQLHLRLSAYVCV